MNSILYIIIIIGLTIFILFFGGHNYQNIVEYDSDYFYNLNTIIIFEKKLNKKLTDVIFDSSNFINLNKYLDTSIILVPNFVDCFYIQIKPYSLFNIFKIIKKENMLTSMMIIFNHKKYNNLELLLDNSTGDLYNYVYPDTNPNPNPILDNNLENNLENKNLTIDGYFYDLEKIISITGIYHVYNNSNENVIITCFILKKPFWFK
jgi:hypothetical protein